MANHAGSEFGSGAVLAGRVRLTTTNALCAVLDLAKGCVPTGTAAAAAAVATGDEIQSREIIFKAILANIRILEHFLTHSARGGLAGCLAVLYKGEDQPIAFDPREQRAVPSGVSGARRA
ncbi:hypothetical protein CYMTET_31638 [Cymbomonas tetramitiformis]|uniref:Uncharacterized protein n=1 Tax=Cymbomonas tetramitiformis TaxID=36881 RepID=A0AAE0FGN3_9CHLO|nr:hypothetical protein CYMTET_31638 [Cymbomonas tetramitiformis]